MSVTKITFKNFKSLANVDLDLAPITVIIGPNGSGKSSVLQALAVLKQSVLSGSLKSDGPLVNLGTFKDIICRDSNGIAALGVGGRVRMTEGVRQAIGKKRPSNILMRSRSMRMDSGLTREPLR